jgi:hypothetical protein
MKRLAVLLAVLVCASLEAQTTYVRPIHVQELPKCNKQRDGVAYAVDNATSQTVLGTGTGSTPVLAQCDGDAESWETVVPASLSGSDLVGDPDVNISTADPSSDIVISAVDDFTVAIGGDISVTSIGSTTLVAGTDFLVDSAAGNITIDTDGAGTDVVITPADDLTLSAVDNTAIGGTTVNIEPSGAIVLDTDTAGTDVTVTPADDLLVTAGDAVTLSAGGDILLDSTAGAVGITLDTDAAGSDINLSAVDDVLIGSGDAITLTGGGAVTLSAVIGQMTIHSGGAGNDITIDPADDLVLTPSDDTTLAGDTFLVSTTTTTLDPGGSTDELNVAAGVFRVGVALGIPAASSLPTCDSTIAPAGTYALYFDTTGPDLCYCNGSAWATIDGSGTCA